MSRFQSKMHTKNQEDFKLDEEKAVSTNTEMKEDVRRYLTKIIK